MDPISAPARLSLLATGHFLPRCLHVAADLGVADHIDDRPVSLELLARQSGCNAPAKVLDVIMLTLTGGRERTRDDYVSLFEACGFRLEKVVPTTGAVSVLVGVPG